MADLTYKVAVDTANAQRSIAGLQSALVGLASAFSIREVVQFGDAVTNLQNKLRQLTPASEDVAKQFNAIAEIASNARAPLAETGDLYFRIARASAELGISQREAANITETLAQAMSASGMSAAEAAGPLLQIGQALQSGRFQGDELKSVLEGMPVVTQALAKEMGVTVGELRKLGSEGQITADVFIRAMRNAANGVAESFGTTVPTIAQAFVNLQNSLAVFFNQIEQQTGTFGTIGKAIMELSANIKSLAEDAERVRVFVAVITEIVTAVAKIGAVVLTFTVLGRAISLIRAGITALAGAWTTATGSITGAAASLGKTFSWIGSSIRGLINGNIPLSKSIEVLGRRFKFLSEGLGLLGKGFAYLTGLIYGAYTALKAFFNIGDAVSKETEKGTEALTQQGNAANTAKEALSDVTGENRAAAAAAAELAKKTAIVTEGLQAQAKAYYDNNSEQLRGLKQSIELLGATEAQIALENNLNATRSAYLNEQTRLQEELRKLRNSTLAEEKANIPVVQELLAKLDVEYRKQVESVRALSAEYERAVQAQKLREFGLRMEQEQSEQLIRLQEEMARMSLSGIEAKYYDIERAADAAARAAIRAEEARRGSPLTQQEQEEYYRRARAGNEALKTQTRELFERSRSFSSGWKKAFDEYADNATNAARRAEDLFRKATKGMEDAIVNFAKTGKFEWKNFVAMMAEELLRAQIQQLFAQIFNAGRPGAAMGGGGGGGGGGLLGGIGSVLGGLFGGGQRQPSVQTPPINQSGGGFLDGITKAVGGIGNVISSAGSWLNKNIFGGFFANGGMLPAGKIGIVGERGPEFISGPASITPMQPMNVTYNINAVDAQSFQALISRDPTLIFALTEQGRKSLAVGRR